MKIFFLLFNLAFVLLVSSCSKEEGETLDDRMVGTQWETTVKSGIIPVEKVLDFITTSSGEIYYENDGKFISAQGTFTYVLEYPYITIIESNGLTASYVFESSRSFTKEGEYEEGLYDMADYVLQY